MIHGAVATIMLNSYEHSNRKRKGWFILQEKLKSTSRSQQKTLNIFFKVLQRIQSVRDRINLFPITTTVERS